MDHPASADNQNESTEKPWPRLPKIAKLEFQQSFAVAQLAVKLCTLKKGGVKGATREGEPHSREFSCRGLGVDSERAQACVTTANRRGVFGGARRQR